ncbi:MAG TPA: STM3941 family protein [Mucilaginibacter sp.]|jgi:hypothetical protein|nr:STM3941 family protein [Mucilaginibacter sp.]
MTEPAQYRYSLKFSVATLAVMIVLMIIVFRNVWGYQTDLVWIVVGFCTLVFMTLSAVIIMKRLVPAIKGNVALQVDDEGISDFVKEISIEWKDVKEIHLVPGRSASIIRVDLKWETNYGSQIAIYLRWVRGKDGEIYDTVMAHFEHYCAGEE